MTEDRRQNEESRIRAVRLRELQNDLREARDECEALDIPIWADLSDAINWLTDEIDRTDPQ